MSSNEIGGFSFQGRKRAIQRFKDDTFDFLIIGGGITGAAVARDAASRGLRVALIERRDFAWGTSSRSSKLIHGGLRYLQNFEFGLVFEALAERALLLKTAPHMVRPVPFFLPVYEGDLNGKGILSLGLWLYDLLALFRTPGFHRNLSQEELLEAIPFLQKEKLKGGFRYYDASMWDDVLTVETLRAAHLSGASVANYTEAVTPIWKADRIAGFRVRDLEQDGGKQGAEFDLRAHRVIVCAGPWTDEVGSTLSGSWQNWLAPSKGVHLVFSLERIPVPGALVMSHPEDGRIIFVIPRPDLGHGVVIVGTTDGPSPPKAADANVDSADVEYLMVLLRRYFPDLNLRSSDILSAYVGVRPLMTSQLGGTGEPGSASRTLQKISREHHIDHGPGGTVIVAGGKYTTHRKMGEEIVDFTLKSWWKDSKTCKSGDYPSSVGKSRTSQPVNSKTTHEALAAAKQDALRLRLEVPSELWDRYGSSAVEILEIEANTKASVGSSGDAADPAGFPLLVSQLRHSIRNEMVVHLEDFYFRRLPLFLSRADHGLPWAERLGEVWAEELGVGHFQKERELERLEEEIARQSAWKKDLETPRVLSSRKG